MNSALKNMIALIGLKKKGYLFNKRKEQDIKTTEWKINYNMYCTSCAHLLFKKEYCYGWTITAFEFNKWCATTICFSLPKTTKEN